MMENMYPLLFSLCMRLQHMRRYRRTYRQIAHRTAEGLAHGLSHRAEEDYRPSRRHTSRRRQQIERERERDWSTRALREYSVDLHDRHVRCVFTSVMQKVYSISSGVGQNSLKTMVVVLGLMTLNF